MEFEYLKFVRDSEEEAKEEFKRLVDMMFPQLPKKSNRKKVK